MCITHFVMKLLNQEIPFNQIALHLLSVGRFYVEARKGNQLLNHTSKSGKIAVRFCRKTVAIFGYFVYNIFLDNEPQTVYNIDRK